MRLLMMMPVLCALNAWTFSKWCYATPASHSAEYAALLAFGFACQVLVFLTLTGQVEVKR